MIVTEKNKDFIREICKKHKVEKLYLFGSAVSDDLKPESDVDFLVKFKNIDPESYFDNYMSLKEHLHNLFHRQIDLVEEQTLKNPILIHSINKSKQLIYG